VTKYLDDSPFNSPANSKAYRDNYDRTFARQPAEIDCPDCDGEGGDEGPVTCSGICDWCGGCRDLSSACDRCQGAGVIEEETD